MLTTLIHTICVVFAFGLWVHAIYVLISHFDKAKMEHPLLIVMFVSGGGLVFYGLILKWAILSADLRDRTTAFVSLVVCNVLLWAMFHGFAARATAKNWSFPKRASAFFFSAAVPMAGIFYLNASRILFLLN